ncbi:hypothetical protein J0895_09970 [Phormidium pseudopriestleyi FRX01]|uniref:Uncharacterized protein n=1 Tax=Phormidium pseudopriestleyi FRX01 TaxID=1759528 RepID=A0ABS3FRE8_9CYAN|nr:hypothetical protein [Phormidium pseudopriestleyi]MBO0349427.1 hypothetical protein [Phormidium pseudopriestleyi FRX01]
MNNTGYSWVIVRGILICFIALIIAFPSQLFLPQSDSWSEIESQPNETGWIKKKGRVNSGLKFGFSLKKQGRMMIDRKNYGIFPLAIAGIPRIHETREDSLGMRWNLVKQTINATRQLLWNFSQALQKLMEKQWIEELVPSPKK